MLLQREKRERKIFQACFQGCFRTKYESLRLARYSRDCFTTHFESMQESDLTSREFVCLIYLYDEDHVCTYEYLCDMSSVSKCTIHTLMNLFNVTRRNIQRGKCSLFSRVFAKYESPYFIWILHDVARACIRVFKRNADDISLSVFTAFTDWQWVWMRFLE